MDLWSSGASLKEILELGGDVHHPRVRMIIKVTTNTRKTPSWYLRMTLWSSGLIVQLTKHQHPGSNPVKYTKTRFTFINKNTSKINPRSGKEIDI